MEQNPQPPVTQQPAQPPAHGHAMSIVGLVFAFVGLAAVGLVLSIIALVRSKRAGKADVIAILGVIFNAIGIVATVFIAFIVYATVVSYSTIQDQASDTKRQADASSLLDAAEAYKVTGNDSGYPRVDKQGFYDDLSTTDTIGLSQDVADKISSDTPSSARPDVIRLSYCGGQDAGVATGMTADYWSQEKSSVETLQTGTGCDRGTPLNGSYYGSPKQT